MSQFVGSIVYLRRMARRYRQTAREMADGDDAQLLIEMARRFDERRAEYERAAAMIMAEED